MNIPAVDPKIKPGIYQGIPNEAYHAGPGVSKSGLWTIYAQSPAHYRFGEREQTTAFDFGEACHLAILQPDLFEANVVRGPDDRRGNKWKDVLEACQIDGKLLLTSGDYDAVMTIRDTIHGDVWLNGVITGGKPQVEASGYFIDQETGELCRVRPDLYREDIGIMLDVKSTQSAHPDAFSRSVVNYGYHAQEAFYTDGWRANGEDVAGFVFLAFEKKPPYAYAVYELPPAIIEEGRAIMRKSLDTYHACRMKDHWPAYGEGVQELSFQRWAYRNTAAPDQYEDAA